MIKESDLNWSKSYGSGEFAFIGDYKIIRSEILGVLVEECEDRMPIEGSRLWFKTVDEALAAIV